MTNLGKWERIYSLLGPDPEPQAYADTETYALGYQWLMDCPLLEDWGCGKGWLRTICPPEQYRGIDGSWSPFADEVVDLAEYRSTVSGIFMRHVIEHDYRWAQILDNALASMVDRMALVLFTPLSPADTYDMEWEPDPGVPNLSFALSDLTDVFDYHGVEWSVEVCGGAKYGPETLIRLER